MANPYGTPRHQSGVLTAAMTDGPLLSDRSLVQTGQAAQKVRAIWVGQVNQAHARAGVEGAK
jgi:hypothetical protein